MFPGRGTITRLRTPEIRTEDNSQLRRNQQRNQRKYFFPAEWEELHNLALVSGVPLTLSPAQKAAIADCTHI